MKNLFIPFILFFILTPVIAFAHFMVVQPSAPMV